MSWYYSMSTRARWELLAVIGVAFVFVLLTIPSIWQARAEVRDDLRRTDITELKRAMEQYNNQFKNYPTPPANQDPCTGSADHTSWLFGDTSPLLKYHFLTAIPHDLRESPQQDYEYCVTQTDNQQTTGFYLQTRLEVPQVIGTGFDEDELRKFNFRILSDHNQTLYRVCGGTEMQCGTNDQ